MSFVFYAEIQDGCQKWRENDFWENLRVDSVDTLWIKIFIEIALSHTISRDKCVFAFYAEIQDGRQKWRGMIFGKSTVCSYPVAQNFCQNQSISYRF